jgi:hypothetical protein
MRTVRAARLHDTGATSLRFCGIALPGHFPCRLGAPYPPADSRVAPGIGRVHPKKVMGQAARKADILCAISTGHIMYQRQDRDGGLTGHINF